jgi:hypothetical protein
MGAALDTLIRHLKKAFGVTRAVTALRHPGTGKVLLVRSLGFTEDETEILLAEIFGGLRAGGRLPGTGAPAREKRPAAGGGPAPDAAAAENGRAEVADGNACGAEAAGAIAFAAIARSGRVLGTLAAQAPARGTAAAGGLSSELSRMAHLLSGEAGLYLNERVDLPGLERRVRALTLELRETRGPAGTSGPEGQSSAVPGLRVPAGKEASGAAAADRRFPAPSDGGAGGAAAEPSPARAELPSACPPPCGYGEPGRALRWAAALRDMPGQPGPEELPPSAGAPEGAAPGPAGLEERLALEERKAMSEALLRRRGNMSRAAEDLGVTRRSMGLRMKRLGMSYKDFRA